MNSQTHLLLASGLLTKRGEKARNIAVVAGAVLPVLLALPLGGWIDSYHDSVPEPYPSRVSELWSDAGGPLLGDIPRRDSVKFVSASYRLTKYLSVLA